MAIVQNAKQPQKPQAGVKPAPAPKQVVQKTVKVQGKVNKISPIAEKVLKRFESDIKRGWRRKISATAQEISVDTQYIYVDIKKYNEKLSKQWRALPEK